MIKKDYPIQPVSFTQVTVSDHFWLDRLETNQKITIPYAFKKCEETGRIQNFSVAGKLKKGTFEGKYPFNDSDVYKVMEGAAYSLQVSPNPGLDQYLDELIKKIAAAQEADGYLYTARTINPAPPVLWCEGPRWSNLYLGHELYNMGHFYEAAAAHYLATGKRNMLDLAIKNADLVDSVFGPGKKPGVPGHQVIEIGLAKLYRITGNKKYLNLAKFFLDERGHAGNRKLFGEYSQDHKPVLEQDEAVGHAVRALYMYAGMADIAALSGDQSYITAIDRLWENVVSKKLYLTGGIGATGAHEGFGPNYHLPNDSAYAETCAAIANVYWNHRMFLLHGDGKYIDVLERTLYNGLLSGISIQGDRFFYPNPLESNGKYKRKPWFGCACCPSNIARFIPSIPGYIYAVKGNSLYVNLFVQGQAGIKLENREINIKQLTLYPWEGHIEITVNMETAQAFDILVRIPGWAVNQPVPSHLYRGVAPPAHSRSARCRSFGDHISKVGRKNKVSQGISQKDDKPIIKINGQSYSYTREKGFARLSRKWNPGDKIELTLPMPVRRVKAHSLVRADRGRVAFERGPIVYCAEGVDNQGEIFNLLIPDKTTFQVTEGTGILKNLRILSADVIGLYREKDKKKVEQRPHRLVMIPYYAWAHRGKGKMAVWLRRQPPGFSARPFELNEVTLLDGPFKHATELNVKSLLNYEPDRLLAKFCIEAGREPKAEHYHGWEDDTLAGHSLGHHLSACALMAQTTGDQRFLDRVNYITEQLYLCQQADGDGYIGAFPNGKRIFAEEIAKGDIRSRRFNLNGIWAPYYTQHKVLAGLHHAYHLCGNQKALEIQKRFADWLNGIIKNLTDEQVQKMLGCEHGGINEALANLYADTGNKKYLEMSRLFYHKAILEPLANGKDILPREHANTQIPKIIGLARLYELTGNEKDRKTAEFFWDRVVNHHSYVTGGHGNHEYFGDPDKLRNRLSEETTETCNVYNMLKLSRHLFKWSASPRVADFYERALFNHILSSQHPGDGRVIYNLSLEMGGQKVYQDPYWFTCCVGTGMENHSKYGRNIFFHNDHELFIFQYIASELRWEEKGLTLRQVTRYPEEQGTTLEFECKSPVSITLQIRYPYWAEKGIKIDVNGSETKINSEPGSFIPISREWKTGDKVEVNIPFSLRLEAMPDDQNRVAVMYGPLVLAGDLGPENDPRAGDHLYVPVLMTTDRNPANWTETVNGQANTFKTTGVGKPRDILLKPFYKTHERRYSIYWDMFTEKTWKEKQSQHITQLEKKKKLEEMTVDFVPPGELPAERQHNFKGEKTRTDSFKNRKYRESRGGWFSFDMKILTGQPMALLVEYWGGFPGSKTFDIFVDGEKIATENISNKKEGQFINIKYDIPDRLTSGKSKVTIKFKAHEGNMAGPVFGVRIIPELSDFCGD
ncbi:MAG: glycoside hydrolase family 127 protein [Candidatus Aminicenantes bacterium]